MATSKAASSIWRQKIDRKTYWPLVLIVLLLKMAVGLSATYAPQWWPIMKNFDFPCLLVLAFVVGGRFRDFGWPAWLGIALVFAITIGGTIILLFATGAPSAPSPEDPLGAIPDSGWILTVLLLAVVIFAGVRKSVPDVGVVV